ncbi:MAG: hypothetical protein U9Q37_03750 [Euryarchaeota archaeon]|nr:hypothetical protein [Euryarchaeota archaeon]
MKLKRLLWCRHHHTHARNGYCVLRTTTRTTSGRDNQITPADAAIALRLATGSRPCDPATFTAADVSGDDRVTASGVLTILQAVAGNIDLYSRLSNFNTSAEPN